MSEEAPESTKEQIERLLNQKMDFLNSLSEEHLVELRDTVANQLHKEQVIQVSETLGDDSKLLQVSYNEAKTLLRALMLFPEVPANDLGARLLLATGMEDLDKEFSAAIQTKRTLSVGKLLQFPDNFLYEYMPSNGHYNTTKIKYKAHLRGLLTYFQKLPKGHALRKKLLTVKELGIPHEAGAIDFSGYETLENLEKINVEGRSIVNVYGLLLLNKLQELNFRYVTKIPIVPQRKGMRANVEVRKYLDKLLKDLKRKEKSNSLTKHEKVILMKALKMYPAGLFNKVKTQTGREFSSKIRALFRSGDIENINMACVLLETLPDEGLFSDILSDAGMVPSNRYYHRNKTVIGKYFKSLPDSLSFYALIRTMVAVPEEWREANWHNGLFVDSFTWTDDFGHRGREENYSFQDLFDEANWIKHLEISLREGAEFPQIESLQSLRLEVGTGYYAKATTFSFEQLQRCPNLRDIEIHFGERVKLIGLDALMHCPSLKTVRIQQRSIRKDQVLSIAHALSHVDSCTSLQTKHGRGTPSKVMKQLS